MCGRYSLTSDLDRLLPRLRGSLPAGLIERYAPRQQVRPSEPVLLQRQEHGQLAVALALWGFVPDWCKDPSSLRRPINARSETVAEKPFFRGAWRHRRALLPADGFYEWQQRRDPDTGRVWKQPWLFRRRDRAPFWLGGLWDRWLGADGGELDTAVILTTAPNDLLRRVHDRMPVVIPDGLEEAWLDALDGPALRALEPLMAPWDPAAWEAVRLPVTPPAPTGPNAPPATSKRAASKPATSGAPSPATAADAPASRAAACGAGRPPVPGDAGLQGELPMGPLVPPSPAARPGDPAASP